MAPSTPPPPRSVEFAALTRASTASSVRSPWRRTILGIALDRGSPEPSGAPRSEADESPVHHERLTGERRRRGQVHDRLRRLVLGGDAPDRRLLAGRLPLGIRPAAEAGGDEAGGDRVDADGGGEGPGERHRQGL